MNHERDLGHPESQHSFMTGSMREQMRTLEKHTGETDSRRNETWVQSGISMQL